MRKMFLYSAMMLVSGYFLATLEMDAVELFFGAVIGLGLAIASEVI